MRKSYANKADENQPEIVRALEAIGWSVAITNAGDGFPDLVIARGSRTELVEVKNPDGYNRLTPDQKEFHRLWRGKIYIIRTVDEVLEHFA